MPKEGRGKVWRSAIGEKSGHGVKVVKGEDEALAIFRQFHDSALGGHTGFNKTLDAISSRYYWPLMSVSIREWVSTHCNMFATCNSLSHIFLS